MSLSMAFVSIVIVTFAIPFIGIFWFIVNIFAPAAATELSTAERIPFVSSRLIPKVTVFPLVY